MRPDCAPKICWKLPYSAVWGCKRKKVKVLERSALDTQQVWVPKLKSLGHREPNTWGGAGPSFADRMGAIYHGWVLSLVNSSRVRYLYLPTTHNITHFCRQVYSKEGCSTPCTPSSLVPHWGETTREEPLKTTERAAREPKKEVLEITDYVFIYSAQIFSIEVIMKNIFPRIRTIDLPAVKPFHSPLEHQLVRLQTVFLFFLNLFFLVIM